MTLDNLAPPLYYAAHIGLKAVVYSLFEKNVDINAQRGVYGSALQVASVRGHERVVQILLEIGADIKARGRHAR